jgi:ethanolamine utilization protein EutN
MVIGRVVDRLVATRKHPAYVGHKLLVVQPVDRDSSPAGDQVVAVDLVDAGPGDLVLVASEGKWTRQRTGGDVPVRSAIVAVLAGVDYDI